MLRLRAFAAFALGLVLAASDAAAEQPMHRIGVLLSGPDAGLLQAWQKGLRERGYAEGRNLQIEYRYYEGHADRIPAIVAELAALRPELIVTSSVVPALTVHSAAPTIPLVFLSVADPI